MTLSTALGMLKVGNTGNEILQILDVIVEDIEQENINDVAEYYAAISAWSVILDNTQRGGKKRPFCAIIHKDYPFFILKRLIKMYMWNVIGFHKSVEKVSNSVENGIISVEKCLSKCSQVCPFMLS